VSAEHSWLTPVLRQALGVGVSDLLSDEEVTDLLIGVGGHVLERRRGTEWREPEGPALRLDASRRNLILHSLAGALDVELSEARPTVEGSLGDGRVRIQGFGAEVSGKPNVVFRLQPKVRMQLEDLVERKMLDRATAGFLFRELYEHRATLVVAGVTGSGKTTLAGALMREVLKVQPFVRWVVVEEESKELRLDDGALGGELPGSAVLPMVTTEVVELDSEALLRRALRAAADRIAVGEVRGKEAAVFYSAASTGHDGSVLTIHAAEPDKVPIRLSQCAAQGGVMISAEMFCEVVDYIVQVEVDLGERRVSGVYRYNDNAPGWEKVEVPDEE